MEKEKDFAFSTIYGDVKIILRDPHQDPSAFIYKIPLIKKEYQV